MVPSLLAPSLLPGPDRPTLMLDFLRHASSLRLIGGAGASLLLLPALQAQIVGGGWPVQLVLDGSSAGESFGGKVALGGDFDGDGSPDLIVASPSMTVAGLANVGSVGVYSGVDGQLILRVDGQIADSRFGYAVTGMGDTNGDGVADLLVGAPFDAPNNEKDAGSAYLFSGADGSLLWRVDGRKTIDKLGNDVANCGDIDGDGVDDAVIGSHAAWVASVYHAGRAVVVSGATGGLIYDFPGFHLHSHFGSSVGGPGDLNLDGTPDIVVGGYGVETLGLNNAGAVVAFSGADGSLLWQYDGQRLEAHRGEALAPAGDFNGDGVPDVLDGSQRSLGKPYAKYVGAVLVHSGVDGTPLFELRGSDAKQGLGSSVAPAGDLDGDGYDDFLVGSPGSDPNGRTDSGMLLVLAGNTGTELTRFEGAKTGDKLGLGCAGYADVNGDGRGDFLVGLPGRDTAGIADAGQAQLLGRDPWIELTANEISASAGGQIDFLIGFPDTAAGRPYGLLFSGTGPGPSTIGGIQVPLTQDAIFLSTSQGNYPGFLTSAKGNLDPAAAAVATLLAAPGDLAPFAGLSFWVCAVSKDPRGGLAYSSEVGQIIVLP